MGGVCSTAGTSAVVLTSGEFQGKWQVSLCFYDFHGVSEAVTMDSEATVMVRFGHFPDSEVMILHGIRGKYSGCP